MKFWSGTIYALLNFHTFVTKWTYLQNLLLNRGTGNSYLQLLWRAQGEFVIIAIIAISDKA